MVPFTRAGNPYRVICLEAATKTDQAKAEVKATDAVNANTRFSMLVAMTATYVIERAIPSTTCDSIKRKYTYEWPKDQHPVHLKS